jgi:preprotein translocase subunit SecF
VDFVSKRRWFFLLSALVILPGLISLLTPPSLVLGIEFTGGTTMTIDFAGPVDQGELRQVLAENGHSNATIQAAGENRFFIRTRTLTPGVGEERSEREVLEQALEGSFGEVKTAEFSEVSPVIAQETVRNAGFALLAAAVGILIYITWAFRRVPSPFRYGVSAIVALVHDVLVVVGIFSILGKVVGVEVNTMFITALLAVIGYSVNDTIVVFDRIRENIQRGAGRDLDTVVNLSLAETLGRSLNTSITLLFTLLALLLLGGPTIRDFILVLFIGVIAGTYSSIGIASQVLVMWEKGELGRVFRFIRRPSRARAK